MSKILITESQYEKLKETLIENVINEDAGNYLQNAATGAATGFMVAGPIGGVIGAAAGLLLSASGSQEGVTKIFQACKAKGMGQSTMAGGTLDAIAAGIRKAIMGAGTDEVAIKANLSKIATIPDLCAVNKRYSENYPGSSLFNDLDGDIDSDSEWNEYVFLPLLRAKRKSEELSKQAAAKAAANKAYGAESVGGGKSYTQQNNYVLNSDGGKTLNIPKGTGYSYKDGKQGATFKLAGNKFGWFACTTKTFLVDKVTYKDPKGYLANNIAKAICGTTTVSSGGGGKSSKPKSGGGAIASNVSSEFSQFV
jgi:hypothetical protein